MIGICEIIFLYEIPFYENIRRVIREKCRQFFFHDNTSTSQPNFEELSIHAIHTQHAAIIQITLRINLNQNEQWRLKIQNQIMWKRMSNDVLCRTFLNLYRVFQEV